MRRALRPLPLAAAGAAILVSAVAPAPAVPPGSPTPNDPEQIAYPAILVLDVALGEPTVLARQAGYLTDWVRAG